MKKGQISIEFVIIMSVLFLLLLFSLNVFQEKQTGLTYSKQQFEAKLLSEKIARTINEVYLSGNGTSTTIILEKKFDYNITVINNAIVVELENNIYKDSPLLTNNVLINSIELGKKTNFRNNNGVIEIETS